MMHWIATTDAELTFVGEPVNPLVPRGTEDTMVTYCSRRTGNVCGGFCTVYTGGHKCLDAPDTQCISATSDVGYCTGKVCTGTCNQLSTCHTQLANGFCFTPNTSSIVVAH